MFIYKTIHRNFFNFTTIEQYQEMAEKREKKNRIIRDN